MAKCAIPVIEISSSDDEETPWTPTLRLPARSISAVKVEKTDDKEDIIGDLDCFILNFDPFESIDFSKKLVIDDSDDSDELSVISERGPVACIDYPHPRHLCGKFPFNKTPHESYCEKCYCYVCDTIAPCKKWKRIGERHCDASDHDPEWKLLRSAQREVNRESTSSQQVSSPPRLFFQFSGDRTWN